MIPFNIWDEACTYFLVCCDLEERDPDSVPELVKTLEAKSRAVVAVAPGLWRAIHGSGSPNERREHGWEMMEMGDLDLLYQ